MRLENDAGDEERKEIWRWIEQSDEHGVAFARVRRAWRMSDGLTTSGEPGKAAPNERGGEAELADF